MSVFEKREVFMNTEKKRDMKLSVHRVGALLLGLAVIIGVATSWQALQTKGPGMLIGEVYQVSLIGTNTQDLEYSGVIYDEWAWDEKTARKIYSGIVDGSIIVMCPKNSPMYVRLSRFVNVRNMNPGTLASLIKEDGTTILPEWTLQLVEAKEICHSQEY